jgi:hypothetical protein
MSDIHIHIDRETPVKVITLEPNGARGAAATVSVGTTTTGNAGTNASVTNSGTSSAAVFNFTIPRGDTGATGAAGPNSVTSATTSDGTAQLNVATIFINQGESGDSRIIIDGEDITARATAGAYTISNDEADKVATLSLDLITIESTAGSVAIYGTGDIVATGIVSTTSHFNTRDSYRYTDSVTGNVATVNFASLSAARTHTFPDASGTIALTSQTVLKSDYTPAHSLLVQQSGTGSPSVVTVGNSTLVGRMAGGGSDIAALSASDARTVLGLGALATTTPAANVATFLAAPTSANLRAAITDETGTGALVFANGNIGAATGDSLTLTKTASPNTREEIFRASVSDAPNDFIGIANGTVTGDRMAPVFFGMMNSVATNWSMGFSGYVSAANDASDSSNFGIVDFAALRSSSTTDPLNGTISNVSNRKLFTWRTADTTYMTMTANGSLGVGTTAPSSRSILDLASTTRGFLPPRMTTAQRDAITSVPAGLEVYDTTTNKTSINNGSAWANVLTDAPSSITSTTLAAAVTDETGTGGLVFATSPTLTTPTIAQINGGTAANDDLTLQGTTNATRTTSYVNLQPNGGNVGIGTSAPSAKLEIFDSSLSTFRINNSNSAGGAGASQLQFFAGSSPSASNARNFSINNVNGAAAGENYIAIQARNDDGTFKSELFRIYQHSKIVSIEGGNFGVSTQTQFGGGAGVIGIQNAATVPTTNPTNGGVLYVEGGALKYRGSSGTITTLAPA